VRFLQPLLQKIYEDKVFGVITEERFVAMSGNMENELSTLKGKIDSTEKAMNDQEQNEKNAVLFAELVRKYTDITELDEDRSTLLDELSGDAELDDDVILLLEDAGAFDELDCTALLEDFGAPLRQRMW
jgi:hypothetical protein